MTERRPALLAALARALPGFALALMPPPALPAQRPARGIDPYTDGAPAALARLGIVSFGPFPLGDGHGTEAVDALVGAGHMRWIETAHFRLGSALAAMPLPEESRDRKAIHDECRQLRKRLPAFVAAPAELDPWLHLHLFAVRIEALYDDLRRRMGVDDAWFASHPLAGGAGAGPNLGCQGKLVVLVFAREADLARYLRRFCDDTRDEPACHRFAASDTLVFATAADARRGRLADPLLLHGHVLRGVAGMLVSAWVGADESVPFWFGTGVGHWYGRRATQRTVDAGELPEEEFGRDDTWDWERRVHARVRRDLAAPWAEMVAWPDGDACRLPDHAVAWSMVDFLFAQGEMATNRWFRRLREQPLRSRLAPPAVARRWHDAAFTAALGHGIDEAQARWRRFVLEHGR